MTANPFFHGIDSATIGRMAYIRPYDGAPAVYRTLSEGQKHLLDHQILGGDCRVYTDHAEVIDVTSPHDNDDDVDFFVGEIMQVIYSVEGKCGNEPIHLGDHASEDAAKTAIEKVSFDRAGIQRCFEISTANVCEQANSWLIENAGNDTLGMFFEVAQMVDTFFIKILGTPWNDQNLMAIDGIAVTDLQKEHKRSGVPDSLINLLHLAAQADVRFLVLDPDADVLEGLPVYSW